MLSVKARVVADTIFKVFRMIQLRINPVYHASQANTLTTRPKTYELRYTITSTVSNGLVIFLQHKNLAIFIVFC